LFSSRRVFTDTLALSAAAGVPIGADFVSMSEAELVVFQDRAALSSPFTNSRASEYEQYVRLVGVGPFKVADDTSVYLMRNG